MISFIVNLAWPMVGFTIVNQYFVPLMIEARAPLPPKTVAAGLTTYRVFVCAASLLYIRRVKRNPLFVVSLICIGLGTLTLAVHFLMNSNGEITSVWSGFAWLPVGAYAMVYTGKKKLCCEIKWASCL